MEPDASNGTPAFDVEDDPTYVLVDEAVVTYITSTLSNLEQRVERLTGAVNSFGQMLDHITQTVNQAGQMFSSGGGLKALMGMMGGKSDG